MHPQYQTSLLTWKADPSLDPDEDEAFVLLEESVVRSEKDGFGDVLLDGRGHEAGVSDLGLAQEINLWIGSTDLMFSPLSLV